MFHFINKLYQKPKIYKPETKKSYGIFNVKICLSKFINSSNANKETQ